MFFVVAIATSTAWLWDVLFAVGMAAGEMARQQVWWVIHVCRCRVWAIPCLSTIYFTVWFCIEAAKSVEDSVVSVMGGLSCAVFLYSMFPVQAGAWTFLNRLTCLLACLPACMPGGVSCWICADDCLCKWNILMDNYCTCPPSNLTLSGVHVLMQGIGKVSWIL